MAQELAKKERSGGLRKASDPFMTLRQEMNKLFDSFWSPLSFPEWTGTFMPSVDISETDTEVHVSAELPGMNEKDIEVTVRERSVTIEGEKEQEEETKEEGLYQCESCWGSFQRTVRLPAEVDSENASAKFKNGVLKITLQKKEKEAKPKKVEIKAES